MSPILKIIFVFLDKILLLFFAIFLACVALVFIEPEALGKTYKIICISNSFAGKVWIFSFCIYMLHLSYILFAAYQKRKHPPANTDELKPMSDYERILNMTTLLTSLFNFFLSFLRC